MEGISAIKALAFAKIFGGGGGGSSNFVKGSFTGAEAEKGSAKSITVPYTGNGYPIAVIIYPKVGSYKEGTDIYTSTQKKALDVVAFAKNDTSTTPDYSSDDEKNKVFIIASYKNSDLSPDSFAASITMSIRTFNQSLPAGNSAPNTVRMTDNKTLKVYIANTDLYGFLAETEYTYIVYYSE